MHKTLILCFTFLAYATFASIKPAKPKSADLGTKPKLQKPAPGVAYEDIVQGTGKTATVGKQVFVHYKGSLANGTQFDSSEGREPFEFILGSGSVIPGWEKGVVGMKVGGKRKLYIEPEMGYGAQGAGPIPPNAKLIFEVELLAIK